MWLINTKTLKLEYFPEIDPEIHKYAILSHTWGQDEVTFADMTTREPGSPLPKLGFEKIQHCCELAANWGLEYAWVDTCCIDKTSSAELSESINSMFRWYEGAVVCFAYLSDVSATDAFSKPTAQTSFCNSRWFTRGWTLQELIAPRNVKFFSSQWEHIGDKHNLIKELHDITGIPDEILRRQVPLGRISVAQRMSWAAERVTTRSEDVAYCLLGIFGINMPMLYGEGNKAFIRLQEEILRVSEDQTIFVWTDPWAKDHEETGLLASHPRFFKNSGGFEPHYGQADIVDLRVELSNLGVGLKVYLGFENDQERVACLRCRKGMFTDSFAYICLNSAYENRDRRVRSSFVGISFQRGALRSIHVPHESTQHQNVLVPPAITLRPRQKFRVRLGNWSDDWQLAQSWLSHQSAWGPDEVFDCWLPGMVAINQTLDMIHKSTYGITAPGTQSMFLKFRFHGAACFVCAVIGVNQNGKLGVLLDDFDGDWVARYTKEEIEFEGHEYMEQRVEVEDELRPMIVYTLEARVLVEPEAGQTDNVVLLKMLKHPLNDRVSGSQTQIANAIHAV